MARRRVSQKAERLLRLLLGVNHQAARAALQTRGFEQADLDEGWRLLRQVTLVRYRAPKPEPSSGLVDAIDAWENDWFPVIDATLQRSFPEAHERVLLNLSRLQGPKVVLSVTVLLSRLDALRAETDPKSRSAVAKLEKRGLTPKVIDEARELIRRAMTFDSAAPIDTSEDDAAQCKAHETAMWDYYLEWSAIARATIKDPALLRLLGFGAARKGSKAAEPEEPEDPEDPEQQPSDPVG